MATTVTHINPDGLPTSPGFSQAVIVERPARTIYVGGQNAVTASGAIDGNDIATQTRRALANLELVLASAGVALADVVSWSIAVVDGHSLSDAFGAFRTIWGGEPPPAVSVQKVVGLAHPAFLVEISAIAVGRD